MKQALTTGLYITSRKMKQTVVTVRTERTGNFCTLSLADDDEQVMIELAISPEIKRILKDIIR